MVRTYNKFRLFFRVVGLNPLKAGQWFGRIVIGNKVGQESQVSIPSKRGNGSDLLETIDCLEQESGLNPLKAGQWFGHDKFTS